LELCEFVVVEQDVPDQHGVLDRGGQLHGVLSEPAVTGDRNDLALAANGGPRAERRRQGEADGAEVAGHQHRLGGHLEVAPEGVGVVAHVGAHHGIVLDDLAEYVEDGRRVEPVASVVGPATRLLRPPDRPPSRELGPVVDAARSTADRLGEHRRRDPDVTEHRDLDRVEPSQRHRVTIPEHEQRALGPGQQFGGTRQDRRGRRHGPVGDPTDRVGRGRVGGRRQGLDLVRELEVGDPALDQGGLARMATSSAWSEPARRVAW
jgi:hypothetical protein